MNQDSDYLPGPLAHIDSMAAYQPGEQPGTDGWIKLNTNENPYPPSPRVRDAIMAAIAADGDTLRLYPDPSSAPLRRAIATHHGVEAPRVLVGNGADDVLNLLFRVYCDATRAAGMTVPSYSLYSVLAAIQNAPMIAVPFDRSMRLDVEKISACGARLFFLTNPNAPTGVAFSAAEVEQVLQRFNGMLVVDETYAPFADGHAAELLSRYPRLIIVRSFSKTYALAGMRVGYALADPRVIAWLDRVRDSYNLDRIAQAAACAAIGDDAYYGGLNQRVRAQRARMDQAYRAWGWFGYPSQANFHFVEPCKPGSAPSAATAADLFQFLRAGKILVRYFPKHALTQTFLRISLGSETQMDALCDRINLWMTQ